jgi:hypothetical protein
MFDALAGAGFHCISDESASDWAARLWPREPPTREWERMAVAERPYERASAAASA